jgi:hypothetical protein
MSAGCRRRMDPYAGFHPLFILPLPAAAQWVRRFVIALCAGHTQMLTRGPRSRTSVSAGLRSNSPRKMVARNWITPYIPYVWRSVSSGIADTIASNPMTSATQRPIDSGLWS